MNTKSIRSFLTQHPLPQALFIGLAILLFGGNFLQLQAKIAKIRAERQKTPYIFLGYQFLGLDAILGNAGRISYLTDKNMDDPVVAMEFAQAEFMLAPITLDLNNPQHEFLILTYKSPKENWKKVKDLGLIPLRQSPWGALLAKNPKVKKP